MAKTWIAEVDLGLSLTQDEINKNPRDYEGYFEDVKNPTDKELEVFFRGLMRIKAESDDFLASANVTVVVAYNEGIATLS